MLGDVCCVLHDGYCMKQGRRGGGEGKDQLFAYAARLMLICQVLDKVKESDMNASVPCARGTHAKSKAKVPAMTWPPYEKCQSILLSSYYEGPLRRKSSSNDRN